MCITQLINEEALQEAITAVEETNSTAEGRWSSWDGAIEIAQMYDVDLCEQGLYILERAIDSHGETLAYDMKQVGIAVWGDLYKGSFWDRQEQPDSIFFGQ